MVHLFQAILDSHPSFKKKRKRKIKKRKTVKEDIEEIGKRRRQHCSHEIIGDRERKRGRGGGGVREGIERRG